MSSMEYLGQGFENFLFFDCISRIFDCFLSWDFFYYFCSWISASMLCLSAFLICSVWSVEFVFGEAIIMIGFDGKGEIFLFLDLHFKEFRLFLV